MTPAKMAELWCEFAKRDLPDDDLSRWCTMAAIEVEQGNAMAAAWYAFGALLQQASALRDVYEPFVVKHELDLISNLRKGRRDPKPLNRKSKLFSQSDSRKIKAPR
jgi:hypothetical protein